MIATNYMISYFGFYFDRKSTHSPKLIIVENGQNDWHMTIFCKIFYLIKTVACNCKIILPYNQWNATFTLVKQNTKTKAMFSDPQHTFYLRNFKLLKKNNLEIFIRIIHISCSKVDFHSKLKPK